MYATERREYEIIVDRIEVRIKSLDNHELDYYANKLGKPKRTITLREKYEKEINEYKSTD